MCLNRKFTEEVDARHVVLARYAKKALQGMSFEDIAISEEVTVADVVQAIEEIKPLNPALYAQVMNQK